MGLIEKPFSSARWETNRPVYVFGLAQLVVRPNGVSTPTPNTPAISLFFAGDVQLAAIAAETMEVRWARHAEMASQTYAWVDALAARHGDSIRVLARAGHRSPSVTSITLPAAVKSSDVLRAVAARGFTIGSGYGKNKDTSIRIGHMGDHTPEGLAKCLAACDEAFDSIL